MFLLFSGFFDIFCPHEILCIVDLTEKKDATHRENFERKKLQLPEMLF